MRQTRHLVFSFAGSLLRTLSGFLSKDSFYLLIERYRKFSLLHQKDRLDRVVEWPLDFDFRRHSETDQVRRSAFRRAVSLFPAHAAPEATSNRSPDKEQTDE